MDPAFDPYYEWLAIPPKDQPPHHYRLLGIEPFETNENVIQRGADRQMSHLRTLQNGPQGAATQRLLNEISAARICLLDPAKRAAYDTELRRRLPGGGSSIGLGQEPPPVGSSAGSTPRPAPPRSGVKAGGGSSLSINPTPSSVGRAPAAPAASTAPAGAGGVSPLFLGVAVGGGVLGGGLLLSLLLWLSSEPAPVVAQNGKGKPGTASPLKPLPRPQPLPKPDVQPLPMPMPAPQPADPLRMPIPEPLPMPGPPLALPTPTAVTGDLPGLVFYAPLDEGQGTAVADEAGGASGKFIGNAKWAEGKFGKAIELDGQSYVDFGNIFDFEKDQPFTITAWLWVKDQATGSLGGRMLKDVPWTGFDVYVTGEAIAGHFVHDVQGDMLQASAKVENLAGNWRHIVLVCDPRADRDQAMLYADGKEIGRGSHALSGTTRGTGKFCLGARSGEARLTGKLDEFRLYNRALNAAEVARLASSDPLTLKLAGVALPSAGGSIIPDLVYYAPLDEGQGAEAVDREGGVKGAILGTPKWVDGKFGKALDCTANSCLDLGQALEFDASEPFSWGAWVRIDSDATGVLMGKASASAAFQGASLSVHQGDVFAELISKNQTPQGALQITVKAPPLRTWVHVMWVYTGSRDAKGMLIYVDGKPLAATVKQGGVQGSVRNQFPFCVGARDRKEFFPGLIDEVRHFRRALTAEEVQQIATSTPEQLSRPVLAAVNVIPDLAFYAPLDEGAGSDVEDAAGGSKGKVAGPARWIEGKFGKAFHCDKAAYIDFGQVCDFDADQPFSWGAWVWADRAESGSILSKMTGGPSYNGFSLDYGENGQTLYGNVISDREQGSGWLQLTSKAPPIRAWAHVMVTYSGGRDAKAMTFYVNGKALQTTVKGGTVQGSSRNKVPFCIGARNRGECYPGAIDEVRVYRRALTAEEVERIATSSPADLIRTSRTVELVLDRDGLPTEVLPHVDRAQDAVAGKWSGEKELLSAAEDEKALVQLPVLPAPSYRLVVVGERLSSAGRLTVGFPVGQGAVAATLFGADAGTLHSVAGVARPAALKTPIDPAKEFVIVCEAMPGRLAVRLNGEEAFVWSGDASQLALPAAWQPRSPRLPFVGTESGAFKIKRIQLARWQPAEEGLPSEAKPKPPTEAEIKDAVASVKNDYRTQIRNARTPEARLAIAEEMSSKAVGTDDPRLNYALLREARDIASDAGGVEAAFSAIDLIADRYSIDVWTQKAKVYTEVARAQTLPARQVQLMGQGSVWAAEAAGAESYAAADEFLEIALGFATKFKDNETRVAVQQRRDDYKLADKLRAEAAAARAALHRNPTDEAAHETLGRYLAFGQGNFRAGALELMQGRDAKLAQAAAAERKAAAALDRKQAAQEWWRYAAATSDPHKPAMQRHALDLLLAALPELAAEQQKETAITIRGMCSEVPALTPRPSRRGLKAWFKGDEGVLVQAGKVYQWSDVSGSNNHAKQDKPEFAMRHAPGAIGARPAVHSEEGMAQCLTFKLPDIASYEGITFAVVGNTGAVARGSETLIGAADQEDLRWNLQANRENLGATITGPFAPTGIEVEKTFVAIYRCDRRGWITTLDGRVVGRLADRGFPTKPHTFCIGCYRPNNVVEYPFGGDIAEILVYDHPLSHDDHRSLVMYLSLKYGLHLPPPAAGP